ncbi:hypothetical protein HC928_11300 [bacterium]|nr:hypothetical protein [bacterium]
MASAATLAATTLEGQLLEAAALIQASENDTNKNPNNSNNVTMTINTDTQVATITANLPLTQTIVTGKPTYEASAYLVD